MPCDIFTQKNKPTMNEIELQDQQEPKVKSTEPTPLSTHQHSQTSILDSSSSKSKQTGFTTPSVAASNLDGNTNTIISKRTTNSAKTSKSRTSITSTSVRLKTCCGTIELNCVRIVSLIGMIINVLAFIIILAMSIQTYVISSDPILEMLVSFSDVNIEYQKASSSVYLGVIVKDNDTAMEWYGHKNQLVDSLNYLLDILPPETSKGILNGSSDANSLPILATQKAIIEQVLEGDFNTSSSMLQTNLTRSANRWDQSMSFFLSSVKKIGAAQYASMVSSMTINLAIIGACLCVAIPVCIAIFVMTIRKERETADRLKSVNLIMLMNTMSDPFFRDLFGQFCFQHNQTTNSYFKLLETLQQIKQGLKQLISLSNPAMDDVEVMSDTWDTSSSVTTTSYGEEEESSIRKRLQVLLNDLNDMFIDSKLGNVRFVDTIGVKQLIEEVSNPVQASTTYLQKNKKQNKTELYISKVEQAQNNVGERLLTVHTKFKDKLTQPANTRKNMLRKYRILFKQQLKNYSKNK